MIIRRPWEWRSGAKGNILCLKSNLGGRRAYDETRGIIDRSRTGWEFIISRRFPFADFLCGYAKAVDNQKSSSSSLRTCDVEEYHALVCLLSILFFIYKCPILMDRGLSSIGLNDRCGYIIIPSNNSFD